MGSKDNEDTDGGGGDGGESNGGKRYFALLGASLGTVVSIVVISALLFAGKDTVAAMGAKHAAMKAEHGRQYIELQADICEIKADIKTLLTKVSALEARQVACKPVGVGP